jgi:hypothetical protein
MTQYDWIFEADRLPNEGASQSVIGIAMHSNT